MNALDEVDDPGLRAALATGLPVGIGEPADLAQGRCQYAIRWSDDVFRLYRQNETLAAVVASYDAACAASHRLLAEQGIPPCQ